MNENKPGIKARQATESLLKAALSQIPFVGTAITEGLFDYLGRVKQERINTFAEGLKKYFESISLTEIDEEYLKSEDFAQFFELVLRKVSETKSKEKLDLFRQVLLDKIKSKEENDFSESFLSLIASLRSRQIEILKIISKHEEGSYYFSKESESGQKILEGENWMKFHAPHKSASEINEKIKEMEEHKRLRPIYQSKYDETQKQWGNLYMNLRSDITDDLLVQELMSKGLIIVKEVNGGGGLNIHREFLYLTNYGRKFIQFVKGND